MTDTESGVGEGEARPGAGSPAARKKRVRRKGATAGGRKRAAVRKRTGGRKAPSLVRRRSARSENPLESLLEGLEKKASQAGSRITELSEEGKSAARRAMNKVAASSRKTITAVKKEWNKMDTAGKVKFVVALLGTLAAASGTIVASKKKR